MVIVADQLREGYLGIAEIGASQSTFHCSSLQLIFSSDVLRTGVNVHCLAKPEDC